MNIGIDIDDTIVDTITPIIKYGNMYNHDVFGVKEEKGTTGLSPTSHYLEYIFGWAEGTKFEFFDKYYEQVIKECKIRRNASEILRKLKDEGHTINFITARFNSNEVCDTEGITRETLKKYKIPYDNLVMHTQKKIDACKNLNIDVFIDDSYDQCKNLQNNGIKSFVITTKMNNKLKFDDVKRVSSWNEIYNSIQQLCNKK